MNEKELVSKVQEWIKEHREELVSDLIRMVNYKSVSRPGEGGYAFGTDCKRCADAMMELGQSYGFDTENDDYYNISILMNGTSEREIGILGHLDVVPEGNGWHYEPYQALEKDGFVIGRGSGDNKGGVLMSLYVMRCMQELGFSLKHKIRLICGFNEEAGMKDVEHYLKGHTAPEYTLVCDGGWAMCIGEKGILTADLERKIATGNLVALEGGAASNAVPGNAFAVIKDTDVVRVKELAGRENGEILITEGESGIKITAVGRAGHAAFPEYGDNAIYKLIRFLVKNQLLTGEAADVVSNLMEAFPGDYGDGLGIAFEDEISGKTTCVGSMITYVDGVMTQSINVRYAIRQQSEELLDNLKKSCERYGLEIRNLDYSEPRYTDPEEPVTKMLLNTCHEFLGSEYEAFTMGGGTHARKFPNALPYGPNGVKGEKENPFGAAHGPDEAVEIYGLLRSMEVYVIALMRLDQML